MQIYEETQQSIIELSPRLEEVRDELIRNNKQLERIADALEKLSAIVGDDDSTFPYANIIATCGVINT